MIKNAPDVMTVKEVMKVLRCGRTKIMEFIHMEYWKHIMYVENGLCLKKM